MGCAVIPMAEVAAPVVRREGDQKQVLNDEVALCAWGPDVQLRTRIRTVVPEQ